MTITDRRVSPTFTYAEAHALLWAVRHLSLDALRDGPYHGPYDRAVGHGALSSAANRLEAALEPQVRKARIGWWVNGDWCPTRAVRDHAIKGARAGMQ